MMSFPTLRHFLRHIAIAGLLASSTFMLAAPADAQTVMRPNVEGAVRENQAPSQPQPRRPRAGVTGLGATQDVVREPRFIVEAVSFKAIDESGPDYPFSSDEVFAAFGRDGRFGPATSTFDDIDTDEGRNFAREQSCILPAIDPDGARNGAWACAPEGAQGPLRFAIALYDEDRNYDALIGGGIGFCVSPGPDNDLNTCVQNHHTELFNHQFTYETAQILSRLDPACRCFTETASQSHGDDTRYEVTFRITRVDTAGEPLGVDRNAASPIEPPTPVVHRSGTLNAQLMQGFELDGGTLIANGGDFLFNRLLMAYFLTPNGGAKIWLGGATARGYAACYANRASADYVTTPVIVPPVGQFACYVTSDGRVGEFQVFNFVPSVGAASLLISYTTWQ